MQKHIPSLTSWLWWLSLLILITGGAIYYLFRMNTAGGQHTMQAANLTAAVSLVLAGVCIISATSNWWMRR